MSNLEEKHSTSMTAKLETHLKTVCFVTHTGDTLLKAIWLFTLQGNFHFHFEKKAFLLAHYLFKYESQQSFISFTKLWKKFLCTVNSLFALSKSTPLCA